MTTKQTCQRSAVVEVQSLQIDASLDSIDVWKKCTTRVSGHHGVMAEVKSTCDSSAVEVQGFEVFQFSDVRNSCNRELKSKSPWGDDH
jgi:hypothetical protein